VREEERTGIAREIHDELGQALTALKMDLSWATRRLSGTGPVEREALIEKLRVMMQMTDDLVGQVRRISAELRPGVLDDLGLVAALDWQAQDFERRSGVACAFRSGVAEVPLDRAASTGVFRIFQEALTNVARHAEARQVEATLEQDGGTLRLRVRDDGKGIPPEVLQSGRSLGLLGLRERARRLGGSVTVERASPRGTVVELTVPVPAPATAAPLPVAAPEPRS
jgi:signal transduction histidine kinase